MSEEGRRREVGDNGPGKLNVIRAEEASLEAWPEPAVVPDRAILDARPAVAGHPVVPLALVADAAAAACAAALAAPEPASAVTAVVADLASSLDLPPWQIAGDLLDRALAEPTLAQLPPAEALRAQITLLAGATVAADVSFFRVDSAGGLQCVATTSEDELQLDEDRHFARLAVAAPAGSLAEGLDPGVAAVGIQRLGVVCGALVVRLNDDDHRAAVETLVLGASARFAAALDRLVVAERNEDHERSLVAAAEKRLVRFGYDLHDGPLQTIAALGAEVRFLADDVTRLVPDESVPALREAFESLIEQIRYVEQGVRSVAQSSESSVAVREPLARAIRRELDAFSRRTGVRVDARLAEELPAVSDSQRIALYRVVQETLTNVREHSGATRVEVSLDGSEEAVSLRVADNGRGFEVERELAAAAGRGRLGLVGIAERIRLLGGVVRITSAPGEGTTLELAIAPWTTRR